MSECASEWVGGWAGGWVGEINTKRSKPEDTVVLAGHLAK